MEQNDKFEVNVYPEGLVISKGKKVYFFSFYNLEGMDGADLLEELAK